MNDELENLRSKTVIVHYGTLTRKILMITGPTKNFFFFFSKKESRLRYVLVEGSRRIIKPIG